MANVSREPGLKFRSNTLPVTSEKSLMKDSDEFIDQLIEDALGKYSPELDTLELLLVLRDRLGRIDYRVLNWVADKAKLPRVKLYELASFYPALREQGPSVREHIDACGDLVCALSQPHSGNSRRNAASQFRSDFSQACRGQCDRLGSRNATTDAKEAPVGTSARNLDDYRKAGGYQYLTSLHNGDTDAGDVIDSLEKVAEIGRSGGNFPVHRKWHSILEKDDTPVVIVNASEGELGTFKDRHILENDPHGVIDGALVAARTIQAQEIIIYLRDEYSHLMKILTESIKEVQESKLIGKIGVRIRRAGGAYICGEETALISSLEGERAYPKERPPFPTESGLRNRPTLVHNVETFYRIRRAWGMRVEPSEDVTRLLDPACHALSVCGRGSVPGVRIIPRASTVVSLIGSAGGLPDGSELGGVILGGAAGTILTPDQCRMSFDDLSSSGIRLGSGSVIVFAATDDIRWIAAKMASFLARESCGKCAPCRIGTIKTAELLGGDQELSHDDMSALSTALREASICGLGRSAGQFAAEVATLLEGRST